MKQLAILGLTLTVLGSAVAFHFTRPAAPEGSGGNVLLIDTEERNPWTNLQINNDPNEFRFCVVSDRTGGHRAEIFSRAVKQINLLQPEFVVSVGDLIEGYTEDKEKINAEWKEFDGYVNQLKMPFFYVVGNHDIPNDIQEGIWKERYGKRYYHFVYRDVLFLALSSEDLQPPPEDKEKKPVRGTYIGDEQIQYVKKTLGENAKVRHTLVFIHKPLWDYGDSPKSRWPEVEKLLMEGDRKYTAFAGHVHRFKKTVHNGRNYYQLATTGGGSRLRGERYGEFDHIAWITMKKDGPVIANVMLDGVYPEDMQKIRTNEPARPEKTPRPKTYPAGGVLTYKGEPVHDADVVVWKYDEKNKKYNHVADARTEMDGSFKLSTYTPDDGVPTGKYAITVLKRSPRFEPDGKPGKHVLPEKYAKAETSGLEFTTKEGQNDLKLNLD